MPRNSSSRKSSRDAIPFLSTYIPTNYSNRTGTAYEPSSNEQSAAVSVGRRRIFPACPASETRRKRYSCKYLFTDENVVPTADRGSRDTKGLEERHVVVQRNRNNRYLIMLTRCDFQFSMEAPAVVVATVVKVFQVIERISRKHFHRHSSMFMQSPTIKRNVIVRAAVTFGKSSTSNPSLLPTRESSNVRTEHEATSNCHRYTSVYGLRDWLELFSRNLRLASTMSTTASITRPFCENTTKNNTEPRRMDIGEINCRCLRSALIRYYASQL